MDCKINFINGEHILELLQSNIPEFSLLDTLMRNESETIDDGDLFVKVKDDNFYYVCDYMNKSIKPMYLEHEERYVLEYWGLYKSYDQIFLEEVYIRNNLYSSHENFETHPMKTDLYYKLIKMDDFKDRYRNYIQMYSEKPETVLFNSDKNILREGDKSNIEELKFLFDIAKQSDVKIFIAGGAIFNHFFGYDQNKYYQRKSDIDIFFVDSEQENILIFINNIAKHIKLILSNKFEYFKDEYINVKRTKNTVSIITSSENNIPVYPEFQFILRIYKTYSEVVHGFDIDCCCMGWDGNDFWMTERCEYAIFNGFNTINFEVMSPSYEYRLAKYGSRGISIYVPNLEEYSDDDNYQRLVSIYEKCYENEEKYDELTNTYKELTSDSDDLDDFFTKCEEVHKNMPTMGSSKEYYINRDIFGKEKGLNLLLLLEMRFKRTKYKNRVENICYYVSDYTADEKHFNYHEDKREFLKYILSSFHKYKNILKYNEYPYNYRYRQDPNYYKYIIDKWADLLALLREKEICDSDRTNFSKYLNNLIDNKNISDFVCNDPYKHKIVFLESPYYDDWNLDQLFSVDEDLYLLMENCFKGIDLPRTIEFKTLNPGEQATGTYHKLIYENRKAWYLPHLHLL